VRYVLRTTLGMGLFAFCWVAIAYGIFQLLQVGTCASGGPYVSARECPDGIEALFFTLFGGVLGLFVAAFVYSGRGAPPGSDREPRNGALIVWFWTGLFWSLAVGSFLGVWGPEANPGPGGKTGGLIVGFMGAVVGAGGLLALWFGRRQPDPQKVRPLVTRAAQTASRFGGTAQSVDRLETLDRLRRQGTLTESEFETLKAKIIREG
jgi:Short C-terminal domain